jgi:hypothetical protein
MPIWIVTTPLDYDPVLIPYDFVEADSENDARIFCSQEFAREDWPHLVAREIDAGPAVTAYAKMHRLYKTNKREWDDSLERALIAALEEW